MIFLLLLLVSTAHVCSAWMIPLQSARQRVPTALNDAPTLHGRVASGIHTCEREPLEHALRLACHELHVGIHLGQLQYVPAVDSILGATGRVLALQLDDTTDGDEEEEYVQDLKLAMSQAIDEAAGQQQQPILVSIQRDKSEPVLETLIQDEIEAYELRTPIEEPGKPHAKAIDFIPTVRIELDGAHVPSLDGKSSYWDTSSIIVFDNLVSTDLRRRLRTIVVANESWEDTNGADPNRWQQGGLSDTPSFDDSIATDGSTMSYGLSEPAIDDLCNNGNHEAIYEFESILSRLFETCVVTRLPEAVMGSTVSQLTANAPMHGQTFEYHIDGDPYFAPPSPWTDVYGRYYNRSRGKPRFMSCLVYLNDEWDASWGAPTRFLDVATDTPFDVEAKPGRVVIMDQDITHTVVAPLAAAGKRPRYSLVWKLILHPISGQQDMTILADERSWPKPMFIGSAERGVMTNKEKLQ